MAFRTVERDTARELFHQVVVTGAQQLINKIKTDEGGAMVASQMPQVAGGFGLDTVDSAARRLQGVRECRSRFFDLLVGDNYESKETEIAEADFLIYL